ncbi:MAG TPA: bifunctional UDP-N-acetylmuramoyl-tripeptide:D-alanyl-D-alanine ligase/alanine racemase [Sediminibacterium sp.]|nr:bifunctional UDP-N-acetylmuramoyl-tripeptide:D-alanyl-D-alanine ligase/alanine racemase [Sediminibacterium sp.]
MNYTLQDIADSLQLPGKGYGGRPVSYLVTDSRKLIFPEQTLFIAISGPRRNATAYIPELYHRGVRAFLVAEAVDPSPYPEAQILQVPDTVKALQQLAAQHRSRFKIPVIGITGSNGKTIVKEWLYQLLQPDYVIVRSPRSYNSQIGVPLSVWQMNERHTLGIFEAGISAPGEMERLERIIQPTLGVFTNIGAVHDEGFTGAAQKLEEKLRLFRNTPTLVAAKDYIRPAISYSGTLVTWGAAAGNTMQVTQQQVSGTVTVVTAIYKHQSLHLTIPFTDAISVQNALTCCTVLLQMDYAVPVIQQRIQQLAPVEMRMQLRRAVNNCLVLNDSYSNDKVSLALALSFLKQQAGSHRASVVLSDIVQSGQADPELYRDVEELLTKNGIHQLYAVGPAITEYLRQRLDDVTKAPLPFAVELFSSTDDFLEQSTHRQFQQEYILLKGARQFEFEQIAHWLEQQVHQTVLEINLTAMVQNLKIYQGMLAPTTKLMAMVKAYSYGSGAGEVARRLQQQQVDYLTVAYADEGVTLRKAGISLPIMVMSPDEHSFDTIVNYTLEPEIFSFELYHAFQRYLQKEGVQQYPVHLKLNTGMNRLGFEPEEVEVLAELLKGRQRFVVKSLFSHLAASEDPAQDAFTQQQVNLLTTAATRLEQALGYPFLKHIANTAAIRRDPQYQFDMVRLGIGLYGVDSNAGEQLKLQVVDTLKTTVAQVRNIEAGETVGYGRKGVVTRNSTIATVRIGYADGYNRKLGNGIGQMYVNGHRAPVIGDICMDMTMIDVTDVPEVRSGDIVEVFGSNIPIQELARATGTIAYEIMTSVSQRVKRVYYEE